MKKTHRQSIYERYEPGVAPAGSDTESTWWFIFCKGQLLIESIGETQSLPTQTALEKWNLIPIRKHYLGTLEKKHCYCVEIDSDNITGQSYEFRDIRSLHGEIDDDVYLLAGRALQIIHWDKTHQYCGQCGKPTTIKSDEWARVCPSCNLINYPRISPAVIVAVIREGDILLAHSKNFKNNMYSVLAGFVEPGETLEECVKREIMEEVGIHVKDIKYFGSQPWPYPHSLMIGFTAAYESGEITVDGIEIEHADWFTPETLPTIPSKVSISRELIDWYLDHYSK